MESIDTINDLSTGDGFQFEAQSGSCGAGFRTEFKGYMAGRVSGVLDAANSLFGGLFGNAADLSERIGSAAWKKARDSAYKEALQELKPNFVQCPRCSTWVCRAHCWNTKKGLCKECAPDLGVEMAAAQSSRSVEEVWAHAAMAEEDKHLATEHWRESLRATCPGCGEPLSGNVKFCPACGAKVYGDEKCPSCKKKIPQGSKFCPECGHKRE